MGDIDVVLMWVDGSDPAWLQEKAEYFEEKFSVDDSIQRYRDWDNLQYVFRGLEQYMPWVRKIHFVTWGHVPEWLNTDSEKLNIVKHEDFIPAEYLPTFNANPIETNLHRIEGLAEKFILFNDDIFIVREVQQNFFFSRNGYPRDQLGFLPLSASSPNDFFSHLLFNNNGVINEHFTLKHFIRFQYRKIFSFRNGYSSVLRSLLLVALSPRRITGFMTPHMPSPFLKSTLQEVWLSVPGVMHQTSLSRFRSITDVNQYLFKQWQFLSGTFKPLNIRRHSKYVSRFPEDIVILIKAMGDKKCKLICINDNTVSGDFKKTKNQINAILHERLPDQSSFEKKV